MLFIFQVKLVSVPETTSKMGRMPSLPELLSTTVETTKAQQLFYIEFLPLARALLSSLQVLVSESCYP